MAEHLKDPSGQENTLGDTISERTKLPLSVVASLSLALLAGVTAWVETRMTVSQLAHQVSKHGQAIEDARTSANQSENRLVRIEETNKRIEDNIKDIKDDVRSLTNSNVRSAGGK